MGSKLYYDNSYIKSFMSQGIRQEQDEEGNWYIILSETAFYPTGGGQPHDTGYLNHIRVERVEEIGGEIRHYIEKPLESMEKVSGEIDWNVRFDHMQQHCGQHILSAAFESLFGMKTVSFHLGKEVCTIDLDVDMMSEEKAWEAEKLANKIILENRPVETVWITEKEAKKYPLRKQLSVTENIRLVIIPEFDYNGCGGTHPKSTGEVGLLKILHWEREKKRVRIHFICGNRILSQFHRKNKVLTRLTQLLSSPEDELISTVEKRLEHEKENEKNIEDLKERLLHFEAKELLRLSKEWRGERVLKEVVQNREIKELQKLARILAQEEERVNVILVAENGDKLQIVCARGNGASLNMKETIHSLLPLINGRGGGNSSFAQGGGDALLTGKELLEKLNIMD